MIYEFDVCNMRYEKLTTLIDNNGLGVNKVEEVTSLNEISTLTFSLPMNNPKQKYLVNENLIKYNGEYYVIKTPTIAHSNDGGAVAEYTCNHLSETLQNNIVSLTSTSADEMITPRNVIDLMKLALAYSENDEPTLGWKVGAIGVDTSIKRGMETSEQSSFATLTAIAEKFNGMLIFHSQTKSVDMVPIDTDAVPKHHLRIRKNLKSVEVKYDTSEMVTRLYCFGSTDTNGNELNIMSVNPTKKAYLENYDYFYNLGYTDEDIKKYPELFVKTNIWRDDNYYDVNDLYEDGIKELAKVAVPTVEITVDALQYNDDLESLMIGDCVRVTDEDIGADFMCNVTKRTKDQSQSHVVTIEITNNVNYRNVLSDMFSSVSTMSQVVTSNGTVLGSAINGIYTDQIYDIVGKYASFTYLETDYLETVNTAAKNIVTESLQAYDATVENIVAENLKSTNANVDNLKTSIATINSALINKAEVTDLQALSANFDTTNVKLAAIDSLLAGTSGADLGIFINLTADNTKIDEATIKKLIASQITVADLKALTASSTDMTIVSSDDGSPLIKFKDGTQQFFDENGNVRIQIGLDSNGQFTFVVYDETGSGVLMDSTGIKESAISDGLIKNTMLADESISKEKLNFPVVNTDENGKVSITEILDGNGDNFGVKYTEFTNSVTEQLEDAVLYSVVLSNDSQTFSTDSSRVALAQSYYTDVIVYQGATLRTDFIIGSIDSANGITVSKNGTRITFSVSDNTRITADSGVFDIPITIDNVAITKTFSWSCAKSGSTGESATMIQLSNENITLQANSVGVAYATTVDVLITGYTGIEQVNTTVGDITGLPTGMSANIMDNGTINNHIVFAITTEMNTQSGIVTIPITANGLTFVKKFSYSLARQGVSGTAAKIADIYASSLIFKCQSDSTVYMPEQIVLTPSYQNCSLGKWQYSANNGSVWTDVTSGEKGLTIGIVDNVSNCLTVDSNSELFTDSSPTVTFKLVSNVTSVYDVVTLCRLKDGDTGEHGVNVKSVTRYYLTQSSSETSPEKPTSYPPSEVWTATEPSYTAGTDYTLYFVDCTLLSDDSYEYSDVSVSSSYTAAKTNASKITEVENYTTECYSLVNKQSALIDEKISKSQVIDIYEETVEEDGDTVVTKKTDTTLVDALNQTTKSLSDTRTELSKTIVQKAENLSSELQSYKNEMVETIDGLDRRISESHIIMDEDGNSITMEEFYSDYKATADGFKTNVVETITDNVKDETSEFRSTIQQLAQGTVEEYVNNSTLSKTVTEIQKSYQGIDITFKNFFNKDDNQSDGVSINTDGITVYRTDASGNTIGKSVLGTNGLEGYSGTDDNSVRIFYFTDKGSGQSEATIDTGVINFKSSASDLSPAFKTEIQTIIHNGATRNLLVFIKP